MQPPGLFFICSEASKDLIEVINYVKSLTYADKQSILLVGISSGGFTSLATASLNIEE